MKISREANVVTKLIVGICCFVVTVFVKKNINWYTLSLGAIFLLVNIITLIIIKIKKNQYNNLFLQFSYNPSNNLFIYGSNFEIPSILLFYCLQCTKYTICIGTIHFLTVLLCYLYIYQGRTSQKTKIRNNIKMKFEYGILNQDIENSPLVKGSFVKIYKRLTNKIIIKDYDNNEYEIDPGMLSDITKVNLE